MSKLLSVKSLRLKTKYLILDYLLVKTFTIKPCLSFQAKRLQKHQAFQAEVSAHQGRLNEIKQTGETLISKRHEASPDIHRQLENLQQRWKQLLAASTLLGRGLEEAQDILDFNTQLEKAMAWIADKELMVQQGDLGRDYEHCQVINR